MDGKRAGQSTPRSEGKSKSKRPLLVAVIGPTAVGKTKLAITIAKALKCEILNADSRQVYRGMPIGTAQPTHLERAAVPHHFVDFVEPDALYSAGQFESDAMAWLERRFANEKCAVLCGGSGLYIKAVLKGLDPVPADLTIRTQLNTRLEKEGLGSLVEELKKLDAHHAATMDTQNPQRVVRALEVCLSSGRPFSSFHTGTTSQRPFDTFVIGLKMERAELIDRINRRTDLMMEAGLKAEVEDLRPHWNANALQTVGYREWKGHFSGEWTEAQVAEEIKLRTRQFAKRQMTWFKKMEDVHWFYPNQIESITEALRVECEDRGWGAFQLTQNNGE
ncbi:MAG: tRNA (adenosine(37)-N6)-dimethylallyltransferase MiaA [Flavobacteriales bacterium]|nr:tRNA (adenosine(37)-N6)-dimethylallyltransferase MiaA [Flavobacteriales bacterium]